MYSGTNQGLRSWDAHSDKRFAPRPLSGFGISFLFAIVHEIRLNPGLKVLPHRGQRRPRQMKPKVTAFVCLDRVLFYLRLYATSTSLSIVSKARAEVWFFLTQKKVNKLSAGSRCSAEIEQFYGLIFPFRKFCHLVSFVTERCVTFS